MGLDGIDPLHQQIAAILIGRIEDGTYPPKTRLDLTELAAEFEVHRNTVVRALDVLREQGLVRGVVGRGTFVLPPDARPPADSGEQAGGE